MSREQYMTPVHRRSPVKSPVNPFRSTLLRYGLVLGVCALMVLGGCAKNASTGWAQTSPIIAAEQDRSPELGVRFGG